MQFDKGHSVGNFLLIGEKSFFTLIHEDGRTRSFSYSGVIDIDRTGNGANMIINHTSTKIVINGSGLELVQKYLIDETLLAAYENKPIQDDDNKINIITEIFYVDEEHQEN